MVQFAVLRAAPSLSLKAFYFLRLSYVRGNPWFGAGILNKFFLTGDIDAELNVVNDDGHKR